MSSILCKIVVVGQSLLFLSGRGTLLGMQFTSVSELRAVLLIENCSNVYSSIDVPDGCGIHLQTTIEVRLLQ